MIPLVKPYIAPASELLPAIQKVLYSGYIAEGEKVYRFEEELGNFIGNRKILALNSGTAALHIALSILEVGSGDEVISTPMTAEPTNTTIALTGAKIVWGDVDASTGLLDPKSVYEKITERTKAIMLVHYAGMICDMDAFNKISEETGVPVIEDSAHCFGGRYNGKVIGSNSRFTCYSFQAIKQMTTVDGGAIAFQNDEDLNAARKLRWFGLDKRVPRLQNDIVKAGFKNGMNNVTAVQKEIDAMGYNTWSATELLENVKEQMAMIQAVLGGIGAISFLVAAIGISNTMVMSTYERTREIGIMKVLGCKLSNIMTLFLLEAAIIGLCGGILGIGFSYGVSAILNYFSASGALSGIGAGDGMPISVIPLWLAICGAIFSTLIGLISGFYPALRATRLSALEAIKNE